MIHSRLSGLVAAAALVLYAPLSGTKTQVLCKGFLPENDLKRPISVFQVGGLTQADFNDVLDQIQAFYAPVIQAKGGTLRINRLWTDDTVNASAERSGSTWVLNMYGGLARHEIMTKDGFTMVACHETGHHLGGAPKGESWFGPSWASNEGEADYFASLRCMRNIFNDADNARFVQDNTIDPVAKQKCEELYTTQAEENLCMREAMAGMVGALMFKALHKESVTPRFDTPDTHVVSQMDDDHPATQCRLDTYYQGSLCVHNRSTELSDSDPNVGTCTAANGQHDGLRPLCWFKP